MKKYTTWNPWAPKDPSQRPAHWANDQGTAFKNPWPSAEKPTVAELLDNKFPLGWYSSYEKKHSGVRDVKVVKPDWGAESLRKQGLESKRESCVIGTTLGHAGTLVELSLDVGGGEAGEQEKGKRKRRFYALFDPIFSERAGPTQYTGPMRFRQPPCQVDDLPGCDVVLISHNHYDHLDLGTITSLLSKFPNAHYFAPLGNKSWLVACGIPAPKVHEMDWYQSFDLSPADLSPPPSSSSVSPSPSETLLKFTCVPAQHNSGRGALDQATTLWSGWVIEHLLTSTDESAPSRTTRKGAVYHVGDSGYRRTAKSSSICPVFKEIGQRFGPFDLAFVPIWRGGTLSFFSKFGLRLDHNDVPSALHATPSDAIDIHLDIRSRASVAMHFGTFVGSEDESLESVMEFREGRQKRGVLALGAGIEGDEKPGDTKDAGNGALSGESAEEKGRAGIIDIGASWAVEILEKEVG